MIFQVHMQKPDGDSIMVAQRDVWGKAVIAFYKEIQAKHKLEDGYQWMICAQGSPYFAGVLKQNGDTKG